MWTGRDPDANFRAELVRAHQLSEGEEEDIRYLAEKALPFRLTCAPAWKN